MDLKKYLDSLGPTTMVDPKLAKVKQKLILEMGKVFIV